MSRKGGRFSPLGANIYLNQVDWFFEAIRRKTAEGAYEAVNYHRFADDIVNYHQVTPYETGLGRTGSATVPGTVALIGVELNQEKTKMVDVLKGKPLGSWGLSGVNYYFGLTTTISPD